MRKILCMLLALCMLCLCLAGCGESPETQTAPDQTVLENQEPKTPEVQAPPEELQTAADTVNASETVTGEKVLENVSFVLVYDPYIYIEDDKPQIEKSTLYSGDMGGQIVTGLHRAGELESAVPDLPVKISQAEINQGLDVSGVNRQAGRAGGQDPVYQKGDIHSFFCFDSHMRNRVREDFTCVYEGESCRIWSRGDSIGEEDAALVAGEFDEKIFEKDCQYFGRPRFTENGGKVNILFYPLPNGLCGFFCRADIFSSQEAPREQAEFYGLNTDHAIITINSGMLRSDMPGVYATLAHELQHLICASEAFYFMDSPFVRTWLDESMSACAEELCYPGIMNEGEYNLLMYLSDNYRKGQSLYNFDTAADDYIGAYGVVYLFEKYLCQHAGDDVFSKIHDYWKNSYRSDVTEAEALYAAVPQSFIDEIDQKYSFPAGISMGFSGREEEWMSKMTLDFYLEAISPELAELMEYTDGARRFMLYSEINPLDIQGGGRIIVATENGSFTIPDDAGKGLIFIGMDQNFQVVTELYTNAK